MAPRQLASREDIYFYDEPRFPGSGFGKALVDLVSALNTDLDWLTDHTRYLQRAMEWDQGGRTANRLLSARISKRLRDGRPAGPRTRLRRPNCSSISSKRARTQTSRKQIRRCGGHGSWRRRLKRQTRSATGPATIESVALTVLANIEAERRPVNAAKLALAAWPRDGDDAATPKLPETLDVLGRIVRHLRERRMLRGHSDPVMSAVLSQDGTRVVTCSRDVTARIWDAENGSEVAILKGHMISVSSAAFSPDGEARRHSLPRHHRACLGRRVRHAKSQPSAATMEMFIRPSSVPDGKRVVTASDDKTARIWDAETGREIATLQRP